jgi:hypothetical protein
MKFLIFSNSLMLIPFRFLPYVSYFPFLSFLYHKFPHFYFFFHSSLLLLFYFLFLLFIIYIYYIFKPKMIHALNSLFNKKPKFELPLFNNFNSSLNLKKNPVVQLIYPPHYLTPFTFKKTLINT